MRTDLRYIILSLIADEIDLACLERAGYSAELAAAELTRLIREGFLRADAPGRYALTPDGRALYRGLRTEKEQKLTGDFHKITPAFRQMTSPLSKETVYID